MNRSREKLDRSDDLWLSHLYERHVQWLYKYGMNICNDSSVVLHAIQHLVINMSDQPELFVAGPTLRFCLFKRLRDLISDTILDDASFSPHTSHSQSVIKRPELTLRQREASFLKLYCGFSYQEVASLMNVDLESSYELVMQAIEISRKQNQGQITTVYEVH
jgi:DNA-directed RNA polymerase specialized sigma24 family protein